MPGLDEVLLGLRPDSRKPTRVEVVPDVPVQIQETVVENLDVVEMIPCIDEDAPIGLQETICSKIISVFIERISVVDEVLLRCQFIDSDEGIQGRVV